MQVFLWKVSIAFSIEAFSLLTAMKTLLMWVHWHQNSSFVLVLNAKFLYSPYRSNHWGCRVLQLVRWRIFAICSSRSSISLRSSSLKERRHLPPEYGWYLEWDNTWAAWWIDMHTFTLGIYWLAQIEAWCEQLRTQCWWHIPPEYMKRTFICLQNSWSYV